PSKIQDSDVPPAESAGLSDGCTSEPSALTVHHEQRSVNAIRSPPGSQVASNRFSNCPSGLTRCLPAPSGPIVYKPMSLQGLPHPAVDIPTHITTPNRRSQRTIYRRTLRLRTSQS